MMVEHHGEGLVPPLTTFGGPNKGDYLHHPAHNKNSSAGAQEDHAVFPTLVDAYRTLWTAGWNARYTQYFLGAPPKVTWSPEAEAIVEREYRRLHFPVDCSHVKGK